MSNFQNKFRSSGEAQPKPNQIKIKKAIKIMVGIALKILKERNNDKLDNHQ